MDLLDHAMQVLEPAVVGLHPVQREEQDPGVVRRSLHDAAERGVPRGVAIVSSAAQGRQRRGVQAVGVDLRQVPQVVRASMRCAEDGEKQVPALPPQQPVADVGELFVGLQNLATLGQQGPGILVAEDLGGQSFLTVTATQVGTQPGRIFLPAEVVVTLPAVEVQALESIRHVGRVG